MPSPLTWQLEGQDTSLTTTVEQAGSAIQRMATDSVAALDRVYAAMQKANGGTTASSGGLGAVPAQAQAASEGMARVTASYTAAGTAADALRAKLEALRTQQAELKAAFDAYNANPTGGVAGAATAASVGKIFELEDEIGKTEEKLRGMPAAAEAATGAETRFGEASAQAGARAQAANEATGKAYQARSAAASAAADADEAAMRRAAFAQDKFRTDAQAAAKAEEEAAANAGTAWDRVSQHIGNLLVNQAVYAGLNLLTQGVSALNTLLFEEPKAKESAVAVYTVELGSASEALTRFNAVQAESLKLGLPLKELTTLDEHLSQIGVTGDTAVTRFGRTLPQLRAQLEDLASLPGMDVTKVDEFFTRGTEGANRLVLSLQTAGIATRQELQNVGVQFSGFSNNIISAGDVTATAVLNIIQQKFSGLAAAQANTMAGIEVSTANAWQKIGQDLGADIFAQSETKAKELRDVLTDPAMDVAAKRLGQDLGSVADVLQTAEKTAIQLVALGPMLEALVQKNTGIDVTQFDPLNVLGAAVDSLTGNGASDRTQRLNATLNLLTDELTHNTAGIEADVVALAALTANTVDATTASSGLTAAQAAAGTSEETAKQQAAQLTDNLTRLKSAVTDLKAEEAGLVDPLQAALDANNQTAAKVAQNYADQTAGLNQQMATVRANAAQASADAQAAEAPLQADLQQQSDNLAALKIKYDALIQPIKDQETALDRVYQKTQDLNRVNDTKHKLEVDRALAVDLFSAEGRAAAARLPQDEASVSDAQAQQTHDTTKAGLEDQVTALQRAQAVEAANIAAQQRGDQDHINAIQAADKTAQAGYKAQEASIQGNLDKVKAYADQAKDYYDGIKKDLQGQIDAIKTAYDTRIAGFEAEERIIERAQGVLAGTADAQAVTLATSQQVLDNIIASANQIGTLQQVLGSPSYPGTSTGVPPNFIGPPSPPGSSGGISATASATIGTPSAPSILSPGGAFYVPGRASGGPVDTGWYTVGEQGPELLHAGGSGSVTPNGGGQDVHLVLEDPSGKVWFETTFKRNESFVRRRVTAMLS